MALSIDNIHKPAPRWFRRTKKAVLILLGAANGMIASWNIQDELLKSRIQLWCTMGVVAILEALEALLSNGEEYTKPDQSV